MSDAINMLARRVKELEAQVASMQAEAAPTAPVDRFGRTPEMIRFQNMMDAGDDE